MTIRQAVKIVKDMLDREALGRSQAGHGWLTDPQTLALSKLVTAATICTPAKNRGRT